MEVEELGLNLCGITSLENFPALPKLRKLWLSDNRIAGGLEVRPARSALLGFLLHSVAGRLWPSQGVLKRFRAKHTLERPLGAPSDPDSSQYSLPYMPCCVGREVDLSQSVPVHIFLVIGRKASVRYQTRHRV